MDPVLISSSPEIVDSELVQGDTYSIIIRVPDYPSADWDAQFALVQRGTMKADIAMTAYTVGGVTDYYAAWISQTVSAGLPVGFVDNYLVMTEHTPPPPPQTHRISLFIGTFRISPNPLGTYEPSTPNQQALAAVNATITLILSQPEASASFNGQSYTLHNIKDLFDIRNELQATVSSELRDSGLIIKPTTRIVQNRFV
jgi:hypothetical protein